MTGREGERRGEGTVGVEEKERESDEMVHKVRNHTC